MTELVIPDTFWQLITRKMQENRLTARSVADRSGGAITHQTVNQYSSPGKNPNPTVEKLFALARGLGISREELFAALLGKEPDYFNLDARKRDIDNLVGELTEPIRNFVEIEARKNKRSFGAEVRELLIEALKTRGVITEQIDPIKLIYFGDVIYIPLRGKIAAGRPIEQFPVDEYVAVAKTFSEYKKTWAVQVDGESMIDAGVNDGDLVICTEPGIVANGTMVIALIDRSETTLKRYYQKNNKIVLEPANPNFKSIVLDPDRCEIQAVVVGIQKKV